MVHPVRCALAELSPDREYKHLSADFADKRRLIIQEEDSKIVPFAPALELLRARFFGRGLGEVLSLAFCFQFICALCG